MEKKCEDMKNFDVFIIFISKNIFWYWRCCFVVRLLRDCEVLEWFYFFFKLLEICFVFDLDDYLNGFKLYEDFF